MKERKFNIRMIVPIGIRKGYLTFMEKSGEIKGELTLFGKSLETKGEITSDGSIRFYGDISPLNNRIRYKAEGLIEKEKISAVMHTEKYDFEIKGTEEY